MSVTLWPPQSPDTLSKPPQSSLVDWGPSIASCEVDDAVVATLQRWVPTYLRHIAESRRLPFSFAPPKVYDSVIDESHYLDQNLPGVFVITARTTGDNVVVEDGRYMTGWLVAVSAIVRGQNRKNTRRLAGFYELACRKALVEHQDLDGRQIGEGNAQAVGTKWASGGEARPFADPNGRGRWLGEGASQFHVFTSGAVQEGVGPTAPDAEPYDELAQVTSVEIDFEGLPPTSETGE